jgi:hypothetical protein
MNGMHALVLKKKKKRIPFWILTNMQGNQWKSQTQIHKIILLIHMEDSQNVNTCYEQRGYLLGYTVSVSQHADNIFWWTHIGNNHMQMRPQAQSPGQLQARTLELPLHYVI